MKLSQKQYTELVKQISIIVKDARESVARSVNSKMLETYWLVGKHIVEYEQEGSAKAEYGRELLIELSKELTLLVGKGFSRSNLTYMRLLFLKYPVGVTASHQLSWAHYYELIKIDNDLERSFYEQQTINERWSVRELRRSKSTALFHRLALSKDKQGVLELSQKGQKIEKDSDLIKEPFILEFLNIPEREIFSEKELEQQIIDNLQDFLLELGKGFAFIGRQYRVTINNRHFFVDLVFYHRILKCFVLIDLKIDEVEHHDIGQMNLYLNYFETELNVEGDNPPIGIILSAEKDDILVEYAIRGITNKLFVSKYQLYLPDKEELENQVRKILDNK